MNDDHLRFLFASALASAGSTDDCPEPEALADTFEQRLSEASRVLVVDHIAACPVCAEAWRILLLERSLT